MSFNNLRQYTTPCLLIFFWVFFTQSCITPAKNSRPKKNAEQKLIPKAGSNEPPKNHVNQEQALGADVLLPIQLNDAQAAALLERLSQPLEELMPADLEMRNQLTVKSDKNPAEEAVLYFLNVQLILNPGMKQINGNFNESAIDTSFSGHPDGAKKNNLQEVKNQAQLNFASLSEEEGFNFEKILKENQHLTNNFAAANLTALALTKENNLTATVSNNLFNYLRDRLKDWPSLPLPKLTEESAPPAVAGPNETNTVVPSGPNEQPISMNPGGPAKVLTPEEELGVLTSAEQLANQGQYEQAVSHAETIVTDSPYFRKAQQKIIEFSSLGMQELRNKAAGAYENAMSNGSQQIRKSYLTQAKEYLITAKNIFPKAEDISTLDNNLKVIEQELAKLGN